ncbi:hypothetical protein BH09PLA1_BH09PLA1_01980 [soil metagenome]
MTLLLAIADSLAQSSSANAPTGYRLFLTPLPVWDYWIWLLIPLCLGVSIVYKAIRCEKLVQVPKQALITTLWILVGMSSAAVALAIVVKIL